MALSPIQVRDDPIGEQQSAAYRKYLPDLTSPRFTALNKRDAHDHGRNFKENKDPPWLHGLWQVWEGLRQKPYRGITSDGNIIPNVHTVRDEALPIEKIVSTTEESLSHFSPAQRKKLLYPVDAPEWRSWSNPEIYLNSNGLRLDEIEEDQAKAVLRILEATLSPEGYDKALSAMRINGFLGDLVEAPRVMNVYSYNFLILGTPSTTQPWGFSFYGHHLCLNVFLYQRQIVVAPFFTGAEPNIIDKGPFSGTKILYKEEKLGLELMRSLSSDLQQKAQIFRNMHDDAMSEDLLDGRWNKDDQRHLCGAFRDNRVVQYEGINVANLDQEQKQMILGIMEQYFLYLPHRSRELQLEVVQSYFPETYFCWIGGYGPEDPFYYRIQSPFVIAEFDHHSGVFLSNAEPAKFHIHTILRLPNAGDYGYAIRSQLKKEKTNGVEH